MSQATALVTNALEFAGPPAASALLGAGFRVVAHDRAFADPAALESYRAAHPRLTALATQDPAELVEQAWSAASRLDVLVSNDAFPPVHTPIAAARLEDLRGTLDHLLVFPFALARAAIPRLIAQGSARVVMITSNRTRLPQAGGAIPDMARAGLNALVKSLSLELAPHGIPVNAIAPNFLYSETYYPRARFIDDPAGRAYVQSTVPAGRLALPEEIGELILYLATMQGSFLTGAIIDFSGGWPAGTPRPG
jgi:3-oxoacyl-[acyl-carrier protein] reductase